MRKFILLLVLASVSVVSAGAASAQDRLRTGASSVDRHPQARPPKTAAEVMAPLSTAERAKRLRKADLDTREAFAEYQSVVAEARRHGEPTDAAAPAVLGVTAQAATRDQISAFGAESDERARQLAAANRATKRAFDKFQSALWRELDLVDAAGAEARVAAFGPDAPAQVSASAQEPQAGTDKDH
jgi:hypothetical protein